MKGVSLNKTFICQIKITKKMCTLIPQISPILWTPILLITTIIILYINSYTFFNYMKKINSKIARKRKKESNWKW